MSWMATECGRKATVASLKHRPTSEGWRDPPVAADRRMVIAELPEDYDFGPIGRIEVDRNGLLAWSSPWSAH